MTRTIRETLGHFKYAMIMAFLCVEEGDHLKLEVKKHSYMLYLLLNVRFIRLLNDLPLYFHY